MYDLALVNGDVYFDNSFHKCNIYIKDGLIKRITPLHLKAEEEYDCLDSLVLPGIIDPHVHFQLDLGNISSRDDFQYGSRAAAFGGVTTIIDFISPASNKEELEENFYKRLEEASNSSIDYKLHACLKNPKGNVDEITSRMKELGMNTVKIFTTYSESNRQTFDAEIRELLIQSKEKDFLVTAHIEEDSLINNMFTFKYYDLPKSRPSKSETIGALKMAKLVEETGGNLYMVHLSSGQTLKKLKARYPDIINKNFIIESCPHYFVFSDNVLRQKDGYLYTCAPPLRPKSEVKLLRSLVNDVAVIGTDHCSFNSKDKNKKYLKDTPLGLGGIEHSFNVMYSLFGERIINKMTLNPAKIHKLYPQKGVIAEGSDADIFIYKLKEQKITKDHGFTDYDIYRGLKVKGEVVSTILRGKFIVRNGLFKNNKGQNLN